MINSEPFLDPDILESEENPSDLLVVLDSFVYVEHVEGFLDLGTDLRCDIALGDQRRFVLLVHIEDRRQVFR